MFEKFYLFPISNDASIDGPVRLRRLYLVMSLHTKPQGRGLAWSIRYQVTIQIAILPLSASNELMVEYQSLMMYLLNQFKGSAI